MYCSNCGVQLAPNASFCHNCGISIGQGTVAAKGVSSVRQSELILENDRAVTGSDLKEAISILFDMEQEVYGITRIIEKIDERISRLGIRYRIDEPIPRQVDVIQREKNFPVWLIGLTGVIGMGIGFFSADNPETFSFFNQIIGGFWGLVIGCVIGWIIAMLISSANNSEAQNELDDEYARERAKYLTEVNRQEARVKQENIEIQSLKVLRNKLIQRNDEVRERLTQYYDMVGIDKDYRNLVPIGYMKDYMRLGISNRLHGTNGLNYFIRQELRADMLQMSMQEISSKLDVLLEVNKAVFFELVTLNNKCDQIVLDLGNVASQMAQQNKVMEDLCESSKMNEYYNSRISAEAEYRNQMDTIFGRWS